MAMKPAPFWKTDPTTPAAFGGAARWVMAAPSALLLAWFRRLDRLKFADTIPMQRDNDETEPNPHA